MSVHDLRGLGFVSDTLKGGEIKVGSSESSKKQSDTVITVERGDRNGD